MFAICVEASHSKGMGHLFRMLNFANYLKKQNEAFIFLINNNDKTKSILVDSNISYEIVDLNNFTLNWESEIIERYDINHWINDRLNTNIKHSLNIINKGIKLITFDDLGSGAKHSNINICGLFFHNDNAEGTNVLRGVNYLILNYEINRYKKERIKIKNILVTLGGSDTYGVTIKVLLLLKKYNIKATIHIGPSFKYIEELNKELTSDYKVITYVSSLIEEFSKYDLAITGGGITPFEANASGLPCLIIANEIFEIQNGEFLDKINTSKFIGHYDKINEDILLDFNKLNIGDMSRNGLNKLNVNAAEKIYKEIRLL